MSQNYIFTSANFKYLDKVRALGSSISQFEPNVKFVWIVVEDVQSAALVLNSDGSCRYPEIDEILTLDMVFGPESGRDLALSGKNVVELSTAVKGATMGHLLRRPDVNAVVYLDPDMQLFNSLQPAWVALNTSDVVVTPHLLFPARTRAGVDDNEISALKHGVYNLGFLAAKPTEAGLRIIDWWTARLAHACVDDPRTGLFTDQRWFDLAMSFFPEIGVIRHPGCNVAPWNMEERWVTRGEMGFLVNGDPLIFWHFSSFDSGAHDALIRKQVGGRIDQMGITSEYRRLCDSFRDDSVQNLPWSLRPKCRSKLSRSFRQGSVLQENLRRLAQYLPAPLLNQARLVRSKYFAREFANQDSALRVRTPEEFVAVVSPGSTIVLRHAGGGGAYAIGQSSGHGEANVIFLDAGRGGQILIRRGVENSLVGMIDVSAVSQMGTFLRAAVPGVVVINHLLGHESWAGQLVDFETPLVIQLHDRYWLTQKPFFLDQLSSTVPKGVYGVHQPLNLHDRVALDDSTWQERWSPILKRADVVFAPSQFLAQEYQGLTSVPITVEYPDRVASSPIRDARAISTGPWEHGQGVRIAVIGGGIPHKGSRDIQQLLEVASESNVPIHLTVFGNLNALSGMIPSDRLDLRPQVPREQLINNLRSGDFHFAWFPLRASESYCMALDDALEAGLLPVARAVGAVEEHLCVVDAGMVWDGEISGKEMMDEILRLLSGGNLKYFRSPKWSAPEGAMVPTFGTWDWTAVLARNNGA